MKPQKISLHNKQPQRRRASFCFAATLLLLIGGFAFSRPVLDNRRQRTNQQSASSACTQPQARQFDFWIGEWQIHQKLLQADGSWLSLKAETKVSPTLDGCALVESWSGEVLFFWEGMKKPEPLQGYSVRAYDPQTGKWFIHWMDTRSPRLTTFEGSFEGNQGVFQHTSVGADGKPQVRRIVFSHITAASVRWELAISSNQGATWQPLWVMEMTKRE